MKFKAILSLCLAGLVLVAAVSQAMAADKI